jgi:hypothetical protein
MLAMKQSARKTWCRGAFVALCAVPTLLVVLWIAARVFLLDGAAQKDDWERELSARLGMTVRIGGLSYPQMGLAELEGVELTDAETGDPFARAEAIEVEQTAEGCLIRLIAPEIDAAQLGRFTRILHDRLLCGGISRGLARCDISARELTLLDDYAPRTLVDLDIVLEPTESGPRLAVSFLWPEATEEDERMHLALSRNSEISPPVTRLTVDTGRASLPCHLAAHFWQPLERLGPEAEFSGTASCTLASRSSAKLSGLLAGVDLDALVSEQFPQILSGNARIKVEAVIEEGRLAAASGRIDVPAGGRISRSLLVAAAEHLGLDNEAGSDRGDVVAYRRLGIGFRIDGARLQLSGLADAGTPGVLISRNTAPLLKAPANHATAAVGLARVLLPDSQMQVPLASQTADLVQLLPAPAIIPASAERARSARSHTPTRLSPGGPSADVIRER